LTKISGFTRSAVPTNQPTNPIHERYKARVKERTADYPCHIGRLAERSKKLKYHTANKIEDKGADASFRSPPSRE
jgi:hypothetical protein